MVKFSFKLSAAGQRANLLAGGNGSVMQGMAVKFGEEHYAEAVALAPMRYDGPGEIKCGETLKTSDLIPGYYGGPSEPAKEYDTVPTVAELIADETVRRAKLAVAIAAEKAEAEAKREAEVARVLNASLDELTDKRYFVWQVGSGPWNDKRAETKGAEVAQYVKEQNDKRAEKKKQIESEQRANREAKLEALKSWVRENGSELAIARLENGFASWVSAAKECYGITVAEKIARGLVEPARDVDGEDVTVGVEDRKSPTVDEIKMLRLLRERCEDSVAEVQLMRVTYDYNDREADEPEVVTEFRIVVTVPGIDEEYTVDYEMK